ncbi:MAG: hypothetical protein DBX53_06140 [Clostridiales bacterium]|nr:MAG: hypothetical protein DBX53_06140 [Clostridiales bacterium]HBV51344.1 hypothetical protein [Clostridiales bacterium]
MQEETKNRQTEIPSETGELLSLCRIAASPKNGCCGKPAGHKCCGRHRHMRQEKAQENTEQA